MVGCVKGVSFIYPSTERRDPNLYRVLSEKAIVLVFPETYQKFWHSATDISKALLSVSQKPSSGSMQIGHFGRSLAPRVNNIPGKSNIFANPDFLKDVNVANTMTMQGENAVKLRQLLDVQREANARIVESSQPPQNLNDHEIARHATKRKIVLSYDDPKTVMKRSKTGTETETDRKPLREQETGELREFESPLDVEKLDSEDNFEFESPKIAVETLKRGVNNQKSRIRATINRKHLGNDLN